MGRVAGVFDNTLGFPCTPPGVDVLEGGKLRGKREGSRYIYWSIINRNKWQKTMSLIYELDQNEFV